MDNNWQQNSLTFCTKSENNFFDFIIDYKAYQDYWVVERLINQFTEFEVITPQYEHKIQPLKLKYKFQTNFSIINSLQLTHFSITYIWNYALTLNYTFWQTNHNHTMTTSIDLHRFYIYQ